MIKTFRGILADAEQEKIRLSTKKGKIGYKITKFQIIPKSPFEKDQESVVKIFKVSQSTVTDEIDFSDGNLLAAAIITNENIPGTGYMMPMQVIFEQEIFNQDIYITHRDQDASESCNYYLELEVVSLTDNAAAVSTLRDIRLNPEPI